MVRFCEVTHASHHRHRSQQTFCPEGVVGGRPPQRRGSPRRGRRGGARCRSVVGWGHGHALTLWVKTTQVVGSPLRPLRRLP